MHAAKCVFEQQNALCNIPNVRYFVKMLNTTLITIILKQAQPNQNPERGLYRSALRAFGTLSGHTWPAEAANTATSLQTS